MQNCLFAQVHSMHSEPEVVGKVIDLPTHVIMRHCEAHWNEKISQISVRSTIKGQAKYIGILGRGLAGELHVQAVGTLIEPQFGITT